MNTSVSDAVEDLDGREEILHGILCRVEQDSTISQRKLAQDLDVALGTVNWVLKRCISKGLIKIQQAPLKRYVYYLTPQGFDEKSRLTAQYIKHSFTLFRQGRTDSTKLLQDLAESGIKNIYLFGDSDLAEIFILSALESTVKVCGIVDSGSSQETRLGVTIYQRTDEIDDKTFDAETTAFVLTELVHANQTWQVACAWAQGLNMTEEQIVVPDLVYVTPALIKKEP